MKRGFWIALVIVGLLIIAFLWPQTPLANINYGVSFSKFHADELHLDWKQTYLALLNDLKVRSFRFSAHWPNTEPAENKYNFSELDFQMQQADKHHASVILAVGRRLPGWPECHEPDWVKQKDDRSQKQALLDYISKVVNRYKNYPNLRYWQVENEPHLTFFSRATCGSLDKQLLKQEVELVRQLDPSRKILVTDSGEFGLWYQAYGDGDVFGTSLYLYVWPKWGPLRYPITPLFFKLKKFAVEKLFGKKPSLIVELSAEPWLRQSIASSSIDLQLQRMGVDKFNEMISFASRTGFQEQYLWGAEWWYWMKVKQNHSEFWDRARSLFNK